MAFGFGRRQIYVGLIDNEITYFLYIKIGYNNDSVFIIMSKLKFTLNDAFSG